METYLFEIQEFGYRALIVEISVIERNDGVCHRILEISQIKFDDSIDENIGIGKIREIVLPEWRFLDPICEREMEFFDAFLISGKRIFLFEFLHQRLNFFHISEISEETKLSDKRIFEAIFKHIRCE